ncbi:hypothetical protein QJQ45_018313 [Haematococcus lacustris]|nr:hypothetical protein QJQ45_018313 [Haematococcus lacustris]
MATTPPVIPPWAENETQVFDNKLWTLTALFHHLKDTKLIRKSEHYALQVTERVGSSRKLIRAHKRSSTTSQQIANLLCKDLANNSRRSEKHTEVGRVLKEVQQIAKTLGDCHKISSALDTAQLEVYGELRGVSAHIDTRFAILFTICKDIRRSKVAPDAAAEELDNFEMGAWDPDMTRVANIILRMTKATEIDGRTVTVIAPAHQRLTWWQVYAQSKFPVLAKAAMRLLSVHVSTCAAERNWSAWGRTFADAHRNTLSIEKAEELVFIQANDELTNSNQRDQEKELAIELY